jgi:hypothetical protein
VVTSGQLQLAPGAKVAPQQAVSPPGNSNAASNSALN